MMRCALISLTSGQVENIILAEAERDTATEGFGIVGLVNSDQVTMGRLWNGSAFVDVNSISESEPPTTQ